MIESRRRTVLWLGPKAPLALRRVATPLGLDVREGDAREVDVAAPDIRALLMPVGRRDINKTQGRLVRLLLPALDHGVLLGIVSQDRVAAAELQLRLARNAGLDVAHVSVKALVPHAEDFARVLREHDGGLPIDPGLEPHDPPPGVGETDWLLLRRAFYGFRRIALTEKSGGRSEGCRVWHVVAFDTAGHCCEPFIAKAGPAAAVRYELDTYRAFVRDHVSFPFQAPCVPERFVRGAKRAVLVSMFAGRAQRFDEFVSSVPGPELAVVALFRGTLSTWRRTRAAGGARSVGDHYVDERRSADELPPAVPGRPAVEVLPGADRLAETYRRARALSGAVVAPGQLWRRLGSVGRVPYDVCYSHGDLNVRNLFVRWHGTDNILIDFSHVGPAPMSRDPSKLEVSIAFSGKVGLGEAVLEQVFRHPLLPPTSFPRVDGRTEAIRQIRTEVFGEGVSNLEYEVTSVCHLLRFAQRPSADPAPEDREEAEEMWRRRVQGYALACRLSAGWARNRPPAARGPK
jgi:hypothetical protein